MCAHTTCIAPNAGALQLAATIRRAHKAARWAADVGMGAGSGDYNVVVHCGVASWRGSFLPAT